MILLVPAGYSWDSYRTEFCYNSSNAFAIHSLDRCLFSRLIVIHSVDPTLGLLILVQIEEGKSVTWRSRIL